MNDEMFNILSLDYIKNYLRIDNSDKEPDEVARLIKETFDL